MLVLWLVPLWFPDRCNHVAHETHKQLVKKLCEIIFLYGDGCREFL